MKIIEILKPEAIIVDLEAREHQQVLVELSERLAKVYPSMVPDASEVARRLLERELQGSTNLGEGLGIPHCRMPHLPHTLAVLGISREGIGLLHSKEPPLHLFVALVSPSQSVVEHLRVLARICRLFKGTTLLTQLLDHSSVDEIYESILLFEQQL